MITGKHFDGLPTFVSFTINELSSRLNITPEKVKQMHAKGMPIDKIGGMWIMRKTTYDLLESKFTGQMNIFGKYDYVDSDLLPKRVYVISAYGQDFIKIGLSKNPTERRREMQTGNMFSLDLLASSSLSKSASYHEKAWHLRLKKYHSNGEWFAVPKKLREWIIDQVNMNRHPNLDDAIERDGELLD